jgi:hypothetical protein
MNIIKKFQLRWQQEEPKIAAIIKKLSTYLVALSGSLSVAYDALPSNFQSLIPQSVLTVIAVVSFISRTAAGLQVKKD